LSIKGLTRTNSIGAKIFGAFVAMSMITGALGGYGLYVLFATGQIVVDTYDKPLMAINFARAASLTFAQMDKELLRRSLVSEQERAAIDRNLAGLSVTFLEDLAVADERALAASERAVIVEIKNLFEKWTALRQQDDVSVGDLQTLDDYIVDRFDALTELIAGHTFVERRKAIWAIADFKYVSLAALAVALLLSAAITVWLARRIARPLSAAAAVADRISYGEFETPIPQGGKDETGVLLHSMAVMQANIRAMMARETAQRRSAQTRLADAIESSREGMVLIDAEGKIALANSQIGMFFPAVAPFLVSGADFATVASLVRSELDRCGDSDEPRAANFQPFDGSLLTGEYQLADGRWIRLSRSNTHDGGFFLFLSDFTEIKEREERYKEAKRQAEEASRAKTNFLANMSHELRTPLNAIIGFSEIIAGQIIGAMGNAKYAEYGSDIVQSARHLLDIINSVLDLAKSEAGKLQFIPEVVDLRHVLEGCATMMREPIAKAKVKFDVTYPEGPLPVLGEPAKLRQIILNLLSNAIKFTPPGGEVSLLAGAPAPGRAEIRVIDTGIGMSADEILIALEPFGQVDSALTRRYEGTGLGLPLTKALAELHGGSLTVSSTPGRGTTITVWLPYADSAAAGFRQSPAA
jgi:signal transduction histidine kinase/HAMP domain-containing protein